MDRAAQEILSGLTGEVTLVIPDATRPLDPARDLAPIAEAIGPERLKVLIALGLHRHMNEAELRPIRLATGGCEILQHDAESNDALISVGDVRLADDIEAFEARFHRAVVECDSVVTVGVVEPHQYAGFSGGAKTLAIGCSAKETISAMHGLSFLRDPRTQLGRTKDNPFHRALWRLIAPLEEPTTVQLVVQVSGPPRTFAGRLRSAYREAVELAERTQFSEGELYDWMHLIVRGPKAASFYQSSRAATYAALVDRPAIREGGLLIVDAPCPEGMGVGMGERSFAQALERGADALLSELSSSTNMALSGGAQRAYVLAKALAGFQIALVGARPMPELERVGIRQFDSVSDAKNAFGCSEHGCTIEDIFSSVPRGPSRSRS